MEKEIKVKVVFTEGYEERFTRAYLERLQKQTERNALKEKRK